MSIQELGEKKTPNEEVALKHFGGNFKRNISSFIKKKIS